MSEINEECLKPWIPGHTPPMIKFGAEIYVLCEIFCNGQIGYKVAVYYKGKFHIDRIELSGHEYEVINWMYIPPTRI